MPVDESYRKQVSLLLKIVPLVAKETVFALKGGTAINLFLRNMPRLSVDIDLTYLPVKDRASSLKEIDAAMRRIAKEVQSGVRGAKVSVSTPKGEKAITKLIVRADGVQIKIEVTHVLRGCVYEPTVRSVSPRVEAEFGFAEMQAVSFADLYAGKIVAALDRQHPRDLFDVRDLLPFTAVPACKPPCLRFAMPVAGHHARLGTRLRAKLCRGFHFRKLNFTSFQGTTRADPYERVYAYGSYQG